MYHWQFFCVTERNSGSHGEHDLMESDNEPQSTEEEGNTSGEEIF